MTSHGPTPTYPQAILSMRIYTEPSALSQNLGGDWIMDISRVSGAKLFWSRVRGDTQFRCIQTVYYERGLYCYQPDETYKISPLPSPISYLFSVSSPLSLSQGPSVWSALRPMGRVEGWSTATWTTHSAWCSMPTTSISQTGGGKRGTYLGLNSRSYVKYLKLCFDGGRWVQWLHANPVSNV